jgi:hypothetical protein
MSLSDQIIAFTRQLYPSGRAFKMPDTGTLEALHIGLMQSEERAYADALAILNSVLPDNSEFTVADASDWERRLGMIDGSANLLADRKLAIERKLSQPGLNPAKGHYLYVQSQLRAAGFDVYVHENIAAESPSDVSGSSSILTDVQHGDFQHGDTQHGGYYNNMVVNHIDEAKDASFQTGVNFRASFFIGGQVKGTFTDVLATRKNEFRQLILQLKQVQNVAFLFINYI